MIALDESLRNVSDPLHLKPIERAYAERSMKQRLHQPEFRGRILHAYEQRCTICALKHGKLLDAAHIIGDDKPHGVPSVDNGLSLCKIHHAAYDANLLGISPDYVVRINSELMDEIEGRCSARSTRDGWPRPNATQAASRPAIQGPAGGEVQEFKAASK